MRKNPIILPFPIQVPEIMPKIPKRQGVRVIASGRSDYLNQVNNVLGFPGIFRGMLDVRVRKINIGMKMSDTLTIAGVLSER